MLIDMAQSWLRLAHQAENNLTTGRNGACKNLGVPMPSHKFKIGDVVTLKPAISRNVPGGTYQVTKRLPENQGEFEYCIRNLGEPYARVARESELMKA